MEHALPQVHLGLLPYSLERLCWRELHTPLIAYEFDFSRALVSALLEAVHVPLCSVLVARCRLCSLSILVASLDVYGNIVVYSSDRENGEVYIPR